MGCSERIRTSSGSSPIPRPLRTHEAQCALCKRRSYFSYFDFYPVPKTSETSSKTHGLIPVWGFGTVVASTHPQIQKGRRVYGYLGMSRYVVLHIEPKISKHSANITLDGMPVDRRPYKQLTFCDTDDLYSVDREDELLLCKYYTPTPSTPSTVADSLTADLWLDLPLYWTSYWMEDRLNEMKYRGANTVLISSASSKTAFILAYRILKRRTASKGSLNVKIIGLTSSSNVAFTKRLGFYDEVYTYKQMEQTKSVVDGEYLYVDVSGNKSLNADISSIISPFLTITLGMTSVEEGDAGKITGHKGNSEDHESFFMPEWLAVRLKELTGRGVKQLQRTAWAELMEDCSSWVKMEHSTGDQTVLKSYEKTLKGKVGPDVGQMFSLWGSEKTTAKL